MSEAQSWAYGLGIKHCSWCRGGATFRNVCDVCDMCAINVRYVCDMCAISLRSVCDMCTTCVRYVCDACATLRMNAYAIRMRQWATFVVAGFMVASQKMIALLSLFDTKITSRRQVFSLSIRIKTPPSQIMLICPLKGLIPCSRNILAVTRMGAYLSNTPLRT